MRVVDQHFLGPARDGAGDGCVGLAGHPGPRALVFAIARAHLLGMEHAGHAFDIGRNQDFHGELPRLGECQKAVSASHWRHWGAASRIARRTWPS
ncbi:hypothetical protein OMF51_16650, partial [Bordetella pertussis]